MDMPNSGGILAAPCFPLALLTNECILCFRDQVFLEHSFVLGRVPFIYIDEKGIQSMPWQHNMPTTVGKPYMPYFKQLGLLVRISLTCPADQ